MGAAEENQEQALPNIKSQLTALTEVESIDLILKVIELTEVLHERKLVHTNLCPKEIFLRDHSLDKMCFLNLYHASWDTMDILKMNLPEVKETMTRIDNRTRNTDYLSPE